MASAANYMIYEVYDKLMPRSLGPYLVINVGA